MVKLKKIILSCLLIACSLLMTGCGSKSTQLTCDIGKTSITITFEKGKITSYYDAITGAAGSKEIENLNDNYLKDVTSNSEALDIMRDVVATNGGNCQ